MTTDANIYAIPPSDPVQRAAWVRRNVPVNPQQRTAWVKVQLFLRGKSFASIATEQGVSRAAVSQAMRMASDDLEKAIAQTIGLEQRELFFDRYAPDGTRLHPVRGAQRDNTGAGIPRNVKGGEAA